MKNGAHTEIIRETGIASIKKGSDSMMTKKVLSIIAGIGLFLCAGLVQAADIPLPPVNLGDTSFEDGIAFPGWLSKIHDSNSFTYVWPTA